jgi:hypothetical protein
MMTTMTKADCLTHITVCRWLISVKERNVMETYIFRFPFQGILATNELYWEANSRSASQEIPLLLRNNKVYYRDHKSRSPVPVLSHINSHRHTLFLFDSF